MDSQKYIGQATELAKASKEYWTSFYRVLGATLGMNSYQLTSELTSIRKLYFGEKGREISPEQQASNRKRAIRKLGQLFVAMNFLTNKGQKEYAEKVLTLENNDIRTVIGVLNRMDSHNHEDIIELLAKGLELTMAYYNNADHILMLAERLPKNWMPLPPSLRGNDEPSVQRAVEDMNMNKEIREVFGKDSFILPCLDQCDLEMLLIVDIDKTLKNKTLELYENLDQVFDEIVLIKIKNNLEDALQEKTLADQLRVYMENILLDTIGDTYETITLDREFFRLYIKRGILALIHMTDRNGSTKQFTKDVKQLFERAQTLRATAGNIIKSMSDTGWFKDDKDLDKPSMN